MAAKSVVEEGSTGDGRYLRTARASREAKAAARAVPSGEDEKDETEAIQKLEERMEQAAGQLVNATFVRCKLGSY